MFSLQHLRDDDGFDGKMRQQHLREDDGIKGEGAVQGSRMRERIEGRGSVRVYLMPTGEGGGDVFPQRRRRGSTGSMETTSTPHCESPVKSRASMLLRT
jgi:hypothetical protein